MLRISNQQLKQEAKSRGYRPEMVEKVYHLLELDECKTRLSMVLPFRKNEIEFLEQLQRHSEIRPELISDDKEFCDCVRTHPLLHWRKQT